MESGKFWGAVCKKEETMPLIWFILTSIEKNNTAHVVKYALLYFVVRKYFLGYC